MPVAYRDASAAGIGRADEEAARGRERVAMTTPDETTATAVLGEGEREGCRQQEWCSRQRKRGTICWSVYRFPMKMRPRIIDTASPGSSSARIGIFFERRGTHTRRAKYDLYCERDVERKYDIVKQCPRCERSDEEEPLRNGDLARLEPRNPRARRVPYHERGKLLRGDKEHLRKGERRT